MTKKKFILHFFMVAMVTLLSACIHEYPIATGNNGGGEDPTVVEGFIEINYSLSWEKIIHSIDFSTKSGRNGTHRFIVEVSKDGSRILQDVEYVDDEEFATGSFRRKLSVPLEAERYEIAAWYDRINTEGNPYFKADNLREISILNNLTTDTLAFHCAFASDILDLNGYTDNSNKTATMVKKMEMQIPAARFQIVATDVQDFITSQKEALNQGDKFTINVMFPYGCYDGFNAFQNYSFLTGNQYSLSGWMRLPFAEYDELTIGQGLLFCDKEENATIELSVVNSALVTVSKTKAFSFPVKPGQITIIKGNFLTHPVDGIFHIDHIWGGEIIYEI